MLSSTMLMVRPLLFGLFVLLSSPAGAEPLEVLVFAGGKTKADAERALTSYKRLEPIFAERFVPAAGYPRTIESTTLAGLKPGFFIAILGICKKGDPALSVVKAAYPGAYARPLSSDAETLACPMVKADALAREVESARSATGVVNVASAIEAGTDERGEDVSSSTLFFVLTDKAGVVQDVASVPGRSNGRSGEGPGGWEYERCTAAAKVKGGEWIVTRRCTDERTGCERQEPAIPQAWTETIRVHVKGTKLTVSAPRKEVTKSASCNEGSDEGD
jgi:hypothetical protein